MPFRLNSCGAALVLVVAGASFGGCANLGDSFASSAFVNPSQYDFYDCERLRDVRVSLVKQADDKQALIDKARTGTGGAVIGEMVYRNDYIAFRAQKKLADEVWQRNGCDAVLPPPLPAAATAPNAAAGAAPVTASPKARAALPSAAPASSAARAIY